MNIKEFLNSPGVTIKNPNKKSKKDKQPVNITLPFTRDNTSSIYSQANDEFDDAGNMLLGIENPEKYEKQGITLTRKSLELRPGTEFRNLDFELADAQSNWTKAGNAILQTVVDEIIGGTVQGFSDLAMATPQALAKLTDTVLDKVFDVKGDKVQDALGMKDEDYSNPVSAKIEEWREKFRNEVAPIYTTPGVDISNGGFGDFGWWMSNIPSIMSSITLLIPTRAATAGIGKLASLARTARNARKAEKLLNNVAKAEKLADIADATKAERVAKELNSFQSFINNPINRARFARGSRDFADAAVMRTIENYQEAHQTYQNMYTDAAETLGNMTDEEYNKWISLHGQEFKEDGVDVSDRDAVAKHIAKRAADRTFVTDYTNMIFDFIQLHSLKDIGKLAKSTTSPSIERMHRASKLISGKEGKEATKALAKSKLTKAKKYATDLVKGSAKKIFSEASEGVEEGINYIASQEGITYGNTLLSLESDTTKSSFWNDRLQDYLSDSEFWESAFWGVAGGVVFGEAAEGFNKVRIAHHNKQEEKKRQRNEKNGEEIMTNLDSNKNPLEDFIGIGEMGAVKAAKESISRRHARANKLKLQLEDIERGKHPFKKGDDNNPLNITNDPVEKELAKIEAVQRFRTELALDAINSGTYDLLVDYIKDENVRQAFVDMGITSAENIEEFVSETLQDLENAKNIYYKELAHVNHQMTAINASKPEEGKIPLEYVQHIARANVTRRMTMAKLDRQIEELKHQIGNATVGDEDNQTTYDVQRTVRLGMLIDAYGRLEADKKAVEEDASLEEWQRAENLQSIKNQQDGIMEAILDSATHPYKTDPMYVMDEGESRTASDREKALGAALYAIRMSKAYKRIANGLYQGDETNPDYSKTDEELMKEYEHVFKDAKSSPATLNQLGKLIDEDLRKLTDENDAESLVNVNKKLFDLYTNLAKVEIQRGIQQRGIASSQIQIKEQVDVIHNRMNSLRAAKIMKAQEVIRKLHDKYSSDTRNIELAVIAAFRNDRSEAVRLARENLTGTDENGNPDSEQLIDAISILNFSAGANEEAFRFVMGILRKNAELHRRAGETNTIFREEQQASQNSQQGSNTTPLTKVFSGQGNAQNGQQAGGTSPQPDAIQNVEVVVENGTTKINKVDDASSNPNAIPVTSSTGGGTYVLHVDQLAKEKQANLLLNPELFGDIKVDILNPDIEISISANPLIDETNGNLSIGRRGKVIAINKQTGEEIDAYGDEPVSEEQSQGGQPSQPQSNPAPTPAQQPPTTEGTTGNAPIPSTGEVTPISQSQLEDYVMMKFGELISTEDLSSLTDDNWNELKAKVKEALKGGVDAGAMTEAQLDKAIDDFVRDIKEASAEERMSMASRYEEPSKKGFSKFFSGAIKSVIDAYLQNSVVKEVNGKKAIRARDILTICAQFNGNQGNIVSEELYNAVIRYLTSPEAAAYEILDIEDIKDGTLRNKINKTTEELAEEEYSQNTYRIDINSLIQANQNNPLHKEALADIKNGTRLTVEYTPGGYRNGKYERPEISFYHTYKGVKVKVGRMPLPDVDTSNGDVTYIMYQGWRVDVRKDGNGNIQSDLYNIFKDICISDPNCQGLRDIFERYNRGQLTKAQAVQQFKNHPYIVALHNQSLNAPTGKNIFFVSRDKSTGQPLPNPVNYNRVFDTILNVFNYTFENTAGTTAADKAQNGLQQQMQDNLERWFKVLHDSYETTVNLYQTQPISSCTVANSNEGAVLMATDGITVANGNFYDKCPVIGDALVPGTNVKFGIVTKSDTKGNMEVTVGGEEDNVPITGYNESVTLLSLFGPSGKPQFVHAFGMRLSDPEIINSAHNNADAKSIKILKAVYDNLTRLVNDITKENATASEVEIARIKLKEFISALISGNDVGLFRSADGQTWINDVKYNDKPAIRGIEISLKSRNSDTPLTFHIYTQDENGNPGLYLKRVEQKAGDFRQQQQPANVINSLFDFITTFYQFDISRKGIISDKQGTTVNNDIFYKKPNGKFVVWIGTDDNPLFHEEYDSYNDFLITNNLVRVNLKKITDANGHSTNFTPTTKNQLQNRRINVNLPKGGRTSQPVSKPATTNPIVSSGSDVQVFEQLKASLPEKEVGKLPVIPTSNLGEKLVEIVKVQNEDDPADTGITLAELKQAARDAGIDVDLFPEKIMYDPYYNEGAETGMIAQTNPDGTTPDYRRRGLPGNTHGHCPKGWVVIGNKLLNMLSSTDKERRNRGITKLIHERLHEIIHDPRLSQDKRRAFTAISALFDIYEKELSNAINRASSAVNKIDANTGMSLEQLNSLKTLLSGVGRNKRERLIEEFTVEGMTNNLMYEFLNRVSYTPGSNDLLDRYDNNGKESLFTKLINFIAKLFGWNPKREGTLHEKFYNILRDFATSNQVESEQEEENIEELFAGEPAAPVEPVAEGPIDNDNIAGIASALDDAFEDDDDEGLGAAVEEASTFNLRTNIPSLDALRRRIPIELQNNFDKLKDNGFIKLKCTE